MMVKETNPGSILTHLGVQLRVHSIGACLTFRTGLGHAGRYLALAGRPVTNHVLSTEPEPMPGGCARGV